MSAQVQPSLTAEQYLELDEASLETRHEYYKGRMYAMSGGTFSHGLIIGNLFAELHAELKKKGQCRVISNDLRVRVATEGLYTYPDIVVVCGEPELALKGGETLVNPILLAEVLSPSSEAYDRGFKAAQYRQLASLKEYVIVSQDEPRVEVMRRGSDGQWLLVDFVGLDAVCQLSSVECDVALAEIYLGVAFKEAAANSQHPSAGKQA